MNAVAQAPRALPLTPVLRWTARLTSLASLGLLGLFLFGGHESMVPTPSEAILMAFFPFGVAAGMILGWWKELWGGLLTVGSLAGFYAIHFASKGNLDVGPYFAIFSLPGALFLICGLVARRGR